MGSKKYVLAKGHQPVDVVRIFSSIFESERAWLPFTPSFSTTGWRSPPRPVAHPTKAIDARDHARIRQAPPAQPRAATAYPASGDAIARPPLPIAFTDGNLGSMRPDARVGQ